MCFADFLGEKEEERRTEGMNVIGGISGMVEECTIKVCPISAVKILVMR